MYNVKVIIKLFPVPETSVPCTIAVKLPPKASVTAKKLNDLEQQACGN